MEKNGLHSEPFKVYHCKHTQTHTLTSQEEQFWLQTIKQKQTIKNLDSVNIPVLKLLII